MRGTYVLPVRERLINRRQQGDLGEASALEWLTGVGATISIPFGHSPDYDLVAEVEGRLLRVQVKTSVFQTQTPSGHPRYGIGLVTNGGNQSWSGVAKRFDSSRADLLFVLVGDGRRWMIPTAAVQASNSILLGGPKYAEFEIEGGRPIEDIVYGRSNSLESEITAGECPSGQRERAVNAPAYVLRRFESCLPHPPRPPTPPRHRFQPSKYERTAGKNGQAAINQKRRVTLPQKALLGAGLRDGDRVHATADGPGRIVLEKAGLPVWAESP